jgi:YfiR/HmsC-like
MCVVGDDAITAALVETARGQQIADHSLEIRQPSDSATWRACHLLFVADGQTGRAAGLLDGIKALPVLTVSDGKDFSKCGGIVELYVENGRMRFAINVDAADRSGLHLSSRLLELARIVRDDRAR